VKVDDTPICIVLKREDYSNCIAAQFQQNNQVDSAVFYYEKALKYDPHDEISLGNLADIYFQMGKYDEAAQLLERGLQITPNDASMNYYYANYKLMNGDVQRAISICTQQIDYNPKNSGMYILLCNIYLQQRNSIAAEKVLVKLMEAGQFDNRAAQMYVNILKNAGLSEQAIYRKMYNALANSLEKLGKKKEAKQYRDALKQ
jgi:tetratricopeptide (TPR) repeat protein